MLVGKISVAPKWLAIVICTGYLAITYICSHPAWRTAANAHRPIGPAPMINPVIPEWICIRRTACTATMAPARQGLPRHSSSPPGEGIPLLLLPGDIQRTLQSLEVLATSSALAFLADNKNRFRKPNQGLYLQQYAALTLV